MNKIKTRVAGLLRTAASVLTVTGLVMGPAFGATLADAPLFTSSATPVKPNIMFVLDDSGSMARSYLPDAASAFTSGEYGFASSQCNGVAYNPDVVYPVPLNYDGSVVGAVPDIYHEDPSDTTNKRSVTGSVTVGAVGSTVSVAQVQGNRPSSAWYDVGDEVTVYKSATQFIVGNVTGWNASTRTLTIKVTRAVGSGTMSNPTVGEGSPSSTEYTFYKYKGTQNRLDFSYSSSGSVVTSSTFYKECDSTVGYTPGKNVFDTVKVNAASAADLKKNYAIWYTWYRTRMNMMKSSISVAFQALDDKYRVGYSTISEDGVTENDDFLNIRDFTGGSGGQKEKFYKNFNSATPSSNTPLRGALAKAGKYFAKKVSGQTYDPVQYSCQRNFTILSTDGFWNTADETTTYGPYGLDGKEVGDIDSALDRPMYDSTKTKNTLADVAAYYYQTDLRTTGLGNCNGAITGVDVCTNNVKGKEDDVYHSFGDAAAWQHMTTFTLGLGVAGTLDFNKDYFLVRTGDFQNIVNKSLNWPAPSSDKPSAVDDLWHAAVNGRGQYFSAGDPDSLADGLNTALRSINATVGSASAASTSSLQPVAGDNDVFVAQFSTGEWWGDVLAFTIDPTAGTISNTKTWSAKAQLDSQDYTTRKIYYPQPGAATPTLRAFNYTNLKADNLNKYFDKFCTLTGASGVGTPTQCDSLADATAANTGDNLVKYLAGDQTMTYYRKRAARLGDIINASPLFIGKPQFKYQDTGYSDYVSTNSGRTSVVLVGANDGMLHAFDRATGNERWAFIPSEVIPKMYKLADDNFEFYHSYYVDGSPVLGDIQVGSTWKTIVIGGMNKGGRGYYALDVTDPGNPKLLWEFRHKNLGYTYGNPIITKRTNGDWVVVFSSGYENNVDAGLGTGDGNGHLFVLDAWTGTQKVDVPTYTTSSGSTAVGSTTTPSNMAKINNWVVTDTDNTSLRFYGGDILGNLWRFDIDSQVAPKGKALRLAQLKGPTGVAQPITVKPSLAEVSYNGSKVPVVYVPTGSYIYTDDPLDKTVQSIYAIKDPLTDTPYSNIRTDSRFIKQTITGGLDANKKPNRTSTFSDVNWTTAAGWYQDFPVGGERVSVNPQLALETLFIGSNLPNSDACTIGGDSFLYEFNINTGQFVSSYVGSVLVQGLTIVQLTTGASAGSIVTIITRSDGTLQTDVNAPTNPTASLKRSSWRELAN